MSIIRDTKKTYIALVCKSFLIFLLTKIENDISYTLLRMYNNVFYMILKLQNYMLHYTI